MKTHFLRENGIQDGQGAYDRYATSLANAQSAKANDPGFCASIDTFVRMATDASQPDLLVLAQSVSEAPTSGPCPPSNYTAANADSGNEQASATAAVTVATPDTKAEPAATSGATSTAATTTAGTPAAEEAIVAPAPAKAVTAPVTETAAAAPASPAAPTRDDALKAAIAALQTATAALQAATAPAPAPAAADAPKEKSADVINVADAPVVPPKEPTP